MRWPGETETREAWQASGLLLACQAGWRRSVTAVGQSAGGALARSAGAGVRVKKNIFRDTYCKVTQGMPYESFKLISEATEQG